MPGASPLAFDWRAFSVAGAEAGAGRFLARAFVLRREPRVTARRFGRLIEVAAVLMRSLTGYYPLGQIFAP
jgi:hypothetical protein